MEKTLSENQSVENFLALSNLAKKSYRTVALSVLVAISSAVLFASFVLASSLKSGIIGLQSRLGADLLVVPEGYEKGAESVLLYGEPNYFYMDRSVVDSIRKIKGVENASAQFYLTSLSESCCDFPVQIIGFDTESDFTVKKWMNNKLVPDSVVNEFLLSGSNVSLSHGSVRFFGSEHKISGRLSKSGTGMDNAIFCDMESLKNIFDDAMQKGFGFISDGDTKNKISTVLVNVSSDSSSDAVAMRIKNALPGVQVIVGEKFIKSFAERISSLLVFFYSIAILVLLTTVISLSVVFSIMINERRREFSILRVLGATRVLLSKIVFFEAAFIGCIGSLSGIMLTSLVVIPFNTLISQKLSLPFAMAGADKIIIFAVIVFILCAFSTVGSAVNGAVRISKTEPYGDVK